ncbi:MAG: TIGR01777 family oxidoreductase [Flavobacteriaceae bacterium]|nr:TIGR01777 family oxidoreductase [Flavobacteriaceae bacterium]
MNIFVTGSSGLVGNELCNKLQQQNYNIIKLNRINNSAESTNPNWDINLKHSNKCIKPNSVIHLAGENIAAKRWNKEQKQKIYDSRILGTKNLIENIISSPDKPQTFICASAIGYYGDRIQELLTEESDSGQDYVSKICKDWEEVTLPLIKHGIRVINLRFGVILSKKGGALKKMLIPFKLGLGGNIGNGQQRFSWISIDDAIKAIIFCLENPKINGPVNVSSPNPVSNKVFTKVLAKQFNKPAFFNMPASLCRLIFGEMANELLLSSQSVMPQKLIKNGFTFNHLDIETALSRVLK